MLRSGECCLREENLTDFLFQKVLFCDMPRHGENHRQYDQRNQYNAVIQSNQSEYSHHIHGEEATWNHEVRIRYSLNTNELIIYFKDGNGKKMRIPLTQMSDGYKSTISLVADIAYRMAILNPQFSNDVIKNTDGVVLIDEVDLHLPPAWQQRILDDLHTIFPKVQFIVSTHAPAVIHSITSEHLRILKDNDVEASPLESYGKDVNGIFRAVMGVPERPAVVMERFQAFHDALNDEDYEKAESMLNELEKLIGDPFCTE